MQLEKLTLIPRFKWKNIYSWTWRNGGAQPKATVIAKGICIVAEINPKATYKRHEQGWVDEVYDDLTTY